MKISYKICKGVTCDFKTTLLYFQNHAFLSTTSCALKEKRNIDKCSKHLPGQYICYVKEHKEIKVENVTFKRPIRYSSPQAYTRDPATPSLPYVFVCSFLLLPVNS